MLASAAHGATVWDNGSPDGLNGYFSDTDTSGLAFIARMTLSLPTPKPSAPNWFWAASAASGSAIMTPFPEGSPVVLDAELAFLLSDAPISEVPEPSTMLLSAVGLAGIWALRRRC
jgi:hypothetical protein